MRREEFVKAYRNTIKNMDMNIIFPCSETEIQPLYSKKWLANTSRDYNKDDKFINSSVVRSMLIMDLFDLYFADSSPEEIKRVVDMYDKYLKDLYYNDAYSLENTNIPISSKSTDYDDWAFFLLKDNNIDILIGQLFSFCYTKWGDMFADNGYEVTGPHRLKDYKVVNNTFYIESDKYEVLQYFGKNNQITIDMFGHSIANNCIGRVVLINEKLVEQGEIPHHTERIKKLSRDCLKKEDMEAKKLWMLSSRIYRYKEIMKINISDYDEVLTQPLKQRIKDVEELAKIIDETLVKGGF